MERLAAHPAPGGYLFRARTGHNLSQHTGAFHLSAVRAGVTDLRFHDLRHTFCTRLRAHADAFTVRDAMTHTNLKTTDIYSNLDLASVRAAVEGLAAGRPALKLVKSA